MLALGLLAVGSANDHMALLAWGVVVAGVAIGVGSAAMIRMTIDDAMDRCVHRLKHEMESAVTATAVGVGQAVAEGLRDADEPVLPVQRAGVHQLR